MKAFFRNTLYSLLVFLIGTAFLLCVGSCQSQEEPAPGTSPACRPVKEQRLDDPTGYTLHEYDAQRNLTKSTTYKRDAVVYLATYQHNAQGRVTRCTYKSMYNTAQPETWKEYNFSFLHDDKGQMTSFVMNSNDDLSREEGTCEYDADGNRVKTTTAETRNGYTSTVIRTYEYKDGNLVKAYFDPGTMGERMFAYEYYPDRENKFKSSNRYPYLTSATPSRNMVKKVTGTGNAPSAFSSVDQYSYEYNDQGFVVKDVHTYTFGTTSSTISRTYEYSCQ
jgi:hypothetical protein